MEDVRGSARLAESVPAGRSVVAEIDRDTIADALRDGEGGAPATLLLDVARHGDGRDDRATVDVAWTDADLEAILEGTTGDRVSLAFDADDLARAFDDVEAHGLRERAAVFTVAATTALAAGAGVALAHPDGSGGTAAAPATQSSFTDASLGGGYGNAAAPVDSLVTDASSGAGYAAADSPSSTDRMRTDASTGAGYAAADSPSSADRMRTDASTGAGYAPAETAAAGTSSVSSDDSSGFSTSDGAIAGGIALAIVGAAFAARRARPPRPI